MNPYWGRVYFYCYPMQPCLIGPVDCISKAEVELRSTMRRLWGEHVAWTRATVSSLIFNLPDAGFVVARLLQTAKDMGHSLRPYYGDELAQMYDQLLTEHITLTGDLVKVTLEGNMENREEIEKKWFRNGDKIAEFLGIINPYLSVEDFRKMFVEHLMLIILGMDSMLTKDFKASVDVFDKIEIGALEVAEVITDAIIKHFPYKFMAIN